MNTGFDAATTNVEPTSTDVENAARAHKEVRQVLEGDTLLTQWGIDSVLIGSYKRHVSIRRIKDVDVFCRLPKIPSHITGSAALAEIKRVLTRRYGSTAVEAQARSLKVEVAEWGGLHVDAVPARPAGARWEIPDHENPGTTWQPTNPEEMTKLKIEMNARMNELYVPAVKLIRQTRRAIGIGKHPGGLYVEMALYHACNLGLVSGDDTRAFYVAALKGVSTVTNLKVAGQMEIPDPTMPGEVLKFRATAAEWSAAAQKLAAAAADAGTALNETRCGEAAIFHRLLGKNTDGVWVYPLPDDCNLDGTTKSRVTAGARTIGTENQRFA